MFRSSLFERAYRTAMLIYPPTFREQFGREMSAFANERLRAARDRGWATLARVGGHLAIDLVVSASGQWLAVAREWRRRRSLTAAPALDYRRDNMDILIQDLRFAVRALLRRPTFTIVAALTLALGIGANTAIFSVVDAVLIRPLPYPDADRLVMIWGTQGTQGQQGVVYADYVDWRSQNRTFTDMGVFRGQSVNLTGRDTPARLFGMFVDASFLHLIGASAERGRMFAQPETEIATKAPVAVVTHEAWEARFGGDPAILGKTIVLNGDPHVVVGILAPGAQTPFGKPDVFLPIPYYPNASGLARGTRGVSAIGLIKPGLTTANAEKDLKTLAKQQEAAYPQTNKGFGVEVQSLKDQVVGTTRGPIYIVLAAVIVVLLIACANVANLQLARGAARHRELSIRAALGAGRNRIAQQLLTESIVLSLVGGVAGLALAAEGTKWLSTIVKSAVPVTSDIALDGTALGFALGLSVLSGILFGVAPAWKASRANVHDTLRARSGPAGHGHARTRNSLVVVQLALSLALLACAGLLTRSLMELQRVDPGFATDNVMTMQFRLPAVKYDTPEKIWAMFDRTVNEIRDVPGVKSAALVRAFPLTGNGEVLPVFLEGKPTAVADAPNMLINSVTPGYFDTMEIPRLAGRDIATSDNRNTLPVMVVNDVFAKRTWPNESAIGKRIRFGGDDRWWTIIGVVRGTKHFTLDEKPLLQGYIPHAQRPQIFTTVAVRTTGDPLLLARSIREAIWRVDRNQPVWGVQTVSQLLDGAVGSPRLIVGLTAGFAIIALLLGAIGIYGVLSYTMSQRTQEIGIRVALGASRRQVVRMVVAEGARIILVAVVIGLAASFAATRLLRSQLYGVGPSDVVTFAVVTAVLTVVALLGCYLPARRAGGVDPMVALRAE